MKDYIIRGIDKKGNIRLFVATSTHMVEEARKTHGTSPTATAALGRVLTAAVLLGITMKGERDALTFKIKGDGPIGSIIAVSNNGGQVKGYVDNPYADLPSRPDGKLDVGGLVGKNGQLAIIKDLGLKEPYIGYSNLVSGEIAEDLVHYFHLSEQQPSAINLGVLVDKDISVRAAGGYILQLLPGVEDKDIDRIEGILKKAKPISTLIHQGLSPEQVMETLFGEFEMEILERKEIEYKCNCNRKRIEGVLLSLGKEEINKIIEEDEKAEIICHFCNKKYHFSKEDLQKLMD
ncbi:33 kDa chaperonin [[Clostridium] ultunense Esp]|uniref:33 kDa chaperonin n=1 Tax=[Clostridium] ultunense Esp TaxID=1288971 RepID=M1ZIW3_9FIRM|nr:Hsp33 family molecular chaperone HslO [Schnuerera ultunensis]CCQ98574.1 33 kDa chaperonin [[Clostridium] ultunense Esp]SHD78561.1 disulfide bond chaperone (heat shock protein HSP33) [[Clostridium] ultunense Esp]